MYILGGVGSSGNGPPARPQETTEEASQSPLLMAVCHSPDDEESTTVGGGVVGLPVPTHLESEVGGTEDPGDVQRLDVILKESG